MFFEKVVDILPKLRTKVQLAGLIVAVAAFVATRWVSPDVVAQICAGAIGVVILGLGLSFNVINTIPEQRRALFIMTMFGMSLVCIYALVNVVISRMDPRSPTERRVNELSSHVGSVRGMVEGCHQYPTDCREAREMAPQHAKHLLDIKDDNLRYAYRIAKYANAADYLVSAATVHPEGRLEFFHAGKNQIFQWIEQALTNIEKSFHEIRQAETTAATGNSEGAAAVAYARVKKVVPKMKFDKAICLAIRVRGAESVEDSDSAVRALNDCIKDLEANHESFLKDFPLETNQHIRWVFERFRGGTR